MNLNFVLFEDAADPAEQPDIGESLKELVTKPAFWIVIGVICALIIFWLIYRRFVKGTPNVAKVIVRGGKIYKVIGGDKPGTAFLVPFKDKVGAEVPVGDVVYNSDKLLVNEGPDKLYKITYSLTYKIVDVEKFFPYANNFEAFLSNKVNEDLRYFVYKGQGDILLRTYVENENEIVKVLNDAFADMAIEVSAFKIKAIEPMGGSHK